MGLTPEKRENLHLSDQERRNLLRILEQRAATSAAGSHPQRKAERHHYHPHSPPLVEIATADQGRLEIVPVARNLSTGGIAFLHAAAIAGGGDCTISLTTAAGAVETIPATVVRCRQVAGRIHEIGVQFKQSIDVEPFISGEVREPATGSSVPLDLATRAAIENIRTALGKLNRLDAEDWRGADLGEVLASLREICDIAMQALAPRSAA